MYRKSFLFFILNLKKLYYNFVCVFILSKEKRDKIREKLFLYSRDVFFKLPFVYSLKKTLKFLQEGYSIGRFGDGEFFIILGNSLSFQKFDKKLQNKLIEVLKVASDGKFMAGIPIFYNKWFKYFYRDTIDHLVHYFNYEKVYANTQVSRVPMSLGGPKVYRKIWEGKKVVFITSKEGRFYNDERFFNNIKEINFIDVPPINAFDKYEEILSEAKKYTKDYLFLIAAGPTATVLAYDLYKLGYQAIDIGHLPNCYQFEIGENVQPELLDIVIDKK